MKHENNGPEFLLPHEKGTWLTTVKRESLPSLREAYRDGQQAAEAGDLRNSNPHPSGSDGWLAWRNGFDGKLITASDD